MGKYRIWFPIISIVVLYCLSVNCQHKKQPAIKSDSLPKLDLKHHHRQLKDKGIKRNHNKHIAHIPVIPMEGVNNLNQYPGFHVRIPMTSEFLKIKKRQIENITTNPLALDGNITLEEKSNGLGLKQETKVNTSPNKTVKELFDKDHKNVRGIINLLNLIKSNVYNLFNEPMKNTTPIEFKNKGSASNDSQVWNLLPVQQSDSNLYPSNNESPIVESRRLDVLPTSPSNTIFKEFKSNELPIFDSRSLYNQPVQQVSTTTLDKSKSNEGALIDLLSLGVLPAQENATVSSTKEGISVEESDFEVKSNPENNTVLNAPKSITALSIDYSRLDVQPVIIPNKTANESSMKKAVLVEAHSFVMVPNPEDIPLNDTKSKGTLFFDYSSLDVQKVLQRNGTESSSIEPLSFDMLPVSQGNLTFIRSESNKSDLFESPTLNVLPVL